MEKKYFEKENIVNILNDIKEIEIYGIEGIIWILNKGKCLIKKIDFNKIIE